MSKSHQSCPLCDSTKTHDLLGYDRAFLNKCSACNFIFSRQIPSDQELEEYYSTEYELTEFFSPITAKRYEEILDGVEHLKKTKNLLDVGTGSAFFAEIAIKRGWNVYGTELTDHTIQTAEQKGLKMSKGKLEDIHFESDFFDLVVCIEVIEHLPYPLSFVKEIERILRKGGFAYISTPNFDSYLRRKLKGRYDVIGYPNHLSYFTANTLKLLFTKNGLKHIENS